MMVKGVRCMQIHSLLDLASNKSNIEFHLAG